jgi:uncharacterized protein
MILEGIVTTIAADGTVNIAPMGPTVDDTAELRRFCLRPFPTAQTYRNLRSCGEGVLHVTDDVLLLARAAVGAVEPLPVLTAAACIRGWVLAGACRYYEFRVVSCDDSEPRARIEAEVVHRGRLRDFFGFNRAKHAVVEAAILATRTHLVPLDEVEAEFQKLGPLVTKTGGTQEREAFTFLVQHLAACRARRESPS